MSGLSDVRISWMADIVELIAPCGLEDCVRRVKLALDRERRAIAGNIRRNRLVARKRIWYANSFQTKLVAEFLPQDKGTFVRCTFSFHFIVNDFIVVWFGFLVVIASSIVVITCVSLARKIIRVKTQ